MATDTKRLLERALDAQRRLAEQGLNEEARVVLDLIATVQTFQPQEDRWFYTTSEAAKCIGVTAQTVKNWVARGMLTGYRLGGRTVIPRATIDEYRPLAEALADIEPLPSIDQIVSDMLAQRRAVSWPSRKDDLPSKREAAE